jgi:hypothetical protein
MKMLSKSVKPIALVASVVFLGGCASFSQDGGFSNVGTLTKNWKRCAAAKSRLVGGCCR